MTATAPRWRVHWVIAELDAGGEIDAHAAMCLRHAIDAARGGAIELILVDLRDLTAIDAGGLTQFRRHGADCRAHGIDLGLLISGAEHHDAIAEAFVLAGLGDQLHYVCASGPTTAVRPVGLPGRALSRRRGRVGTAARRRSPRRRQRSRNA